jgi:hypothetical protein
VSADEQQGREVPREAQTGAQRRGQRPPFWRRVFGR